MRKDVKIGFVGGGQMCEAIAGGMLASGGVEPGQVFVTDIDQARLAHMEKTYGVNTQPNADNTGAGRLAKTCDVLILAVKPQYARPVLKALAGIPASLPVYSIMGGITLSFLEEYFPENPVFRIMPNTPMLVRQGVAGIAANHRCSEQDKVLCHDLFQLVGRAYFLEENLMDAETAVAGCAPAYGYLFIEALADGAVEMGLPRAMALSMAAQALAGAASMVLETGQHPGQLKDSVTSPGGSTIAGVHALESGAFRATVMNAVVESCERMRDVGKKA